MGKWEIPPKGGHMDEADGIYFQNMTMKDVEKRLEKCDLIIIPIGSTEAHGPHQPIWYGSHPYHHIGMPGTIPLDEETFTASVSQVMAGFWNVGFRKQILLNGHGQEYVIPTAIHRFAKRFQVPGVFVNLNWYYAIPEHCRDKEHGGPFETPFIHADEAETSFSLALFPEMIKMEDAVDTEPKGYMPPGHIDKAGNLYGKPIPWYAQVGLGAIEIAATPEGSVGKGWITWSVSSGT